MTRSLLCLAAAFGLAACAAPTTTPAMRAAEASSPAEAVPPSQTTTVPLPDGHSFKCTAYPGPITCPLE